MKSRTIEIIDNHIKALEDELEWYQQKNREWQEKCEELEKPEVFDKYPHFTTFLGKPIDYWITLQQENARLREQLRWHSVDELPKAELLIPWASVSVVLQQPMRLKIIAWYSFKENEWRTVRNERITVSHYSKWCYIPDDNQGTDCTQEGE